MVPSHHPGRAQVRKLLSSLSLRKSSVWILTEGICWNPSATDWFFFLVLDIGNPAIEQIPLGVRFIIGLLQATAVRAAGFGTVTLSALAPAVQYVFLLGRCES